MHCCDFGSVSHEIGRQSPRDLVAGRRPYRLRGRPAAVPVPLKSGLPRIGTAWLFLSFGSQLRVHDVLRVFTPSYQPRSSPDVHVQAEEKSVFEDVDEETYKEIVAKRRRENDFVVDDGEALSRPTSLQPPEPTARRCAARRLCFTM